MVTGVADFAVQLVAEINGIPLTSWVFPENRDSGFANIPFQKIFYRFLLITLALILIEN